ncbi:MAG TPA: glycosyltransferase [Acidimicrobiales bacterium]|jgi:hypothetical protein|nr:glycosyltransferase [Acidimicrobiales bacterium]
MAPRASWAAPSADVSFLASGAALLRVEPPGVITIHGVGDVLRIEAGGFSSRSVGTLLRRAASEGVIVHALCHAAADAVIAVLKLDRASVVVALPGIDRVEPAMPGRDDDDAAAVGVVTGTNPALDVSMVDSICQRGVKAELIDAAAAATSRSCVVFASADDGFPFAALEALARDTPVVVPRSPTTTEILEGAVSLVDAHTASDLADAAVALATSDAHRGLAVAAGRARAGDFSCHGRATELVTVLRRARAAR